MGSKLVFVNRFFHPDISATSQMLSDLAFHMADRHLVHVVTSRITYERDHERLAPTERARRTVIHRVWTSRFGRRSLAGRTSDYLTFYLFATLGLLRVLKCGDVVVCMTDPPLLSLPVAMVAWLKGATRVNWLHDLFPEVAGQLDFKRFRRFFVGPLAWLRDRSLSGAACNVVLGDLMAATLSRRGIAPDRIRVIPNWASSDRIAPLPRELNPLRREWKLQGKFVVGYSGNFGRAHEFASLLGAARALLQRPDIVFLLIGGGRHRAMLEQEAESQNLTNVMFQAYQPLELLSQSLSAADCHVVSLKPALEGLIVPSKVYSAMAAGRPVIFLGAPDGEIPRTVSAGEPFGVCLAPDDVDGLVKAIEQMCDCPESAAKLGEAGRLRFEERFDQPIALAKWTDLMSELGVKSGPAVPAPETSAVLRTDSQVCPSCAFGAARRSRSRTRAERVRRDLTSDRVYRCHRCGWRGWLPLLDAGGSQGLGNQHGAPDLAKLDSDTARRLVRVASASLEDFD